MKIIAESASNHNGEITYLKKLAAASKKSGADFFTCQIIDLGSFCVKEYSRWEIVKEITLSKDEWVTFFEYCIQINMQLIPCPLDISSLELVLSKGFDLIKIHATDILNIPFLRKIKDSKAKVLLETQCATIRDIEVAIMNVGYDNIECLIHGFSNYPTEGSDQNLGAIIDLSKRFGGNIGFADHTLDKVETPLIAFASGSSYLEKHITVSRNDRNYDWQVSLEPEEFAIMVKTVQKHKKSIGKGLKHPVSSEISFRNVLYKKLIQNKDGDLDFKRADSGKTYYSHTYLSFPSKNIVAALISRLKSKRLKNKVLLPFHNDRLLFDLYNRTQTSKHIKRIEIATSDLLEDFPIQEEAQKRGMNVFQGDPLIVIQRMLEIGERNKASGVFRITGDNPFTDPELMDEMCELFWAEELDYVRAGNVPLGVSAELYSISYLQKLYQEMEDPRQSEYLTWFVMQDKTAKKGVINVNFKGLDLSFHALTVDFQQDYDRCMKLLEAIGKKDVRQIQLADVLNNLEKLKEIDPETMIKLPDHESISFREFINLQKNQGYTIEKEIVVN